MDKNISIFSHTFISELYMLQTHLDKVTKIFGIKITNNDQMLAKCTIAFVFRLLVLKPAVYCKTTIYIQLLARQVLCN